MRQIGTHKRMRLFCIIDIYSVCRLIGNLIIPNLNVFKFEKIKISNLDQITPPLYNTNYISLNLKNAFGIDFGLWEVPKIDSDDYDDDYDYDDDEDNDDYDDDYDTFSSPQRISNTICTRGGDLFCLVKM